jgi:LacI family transcriptional regulator
MLSGWNSSRVKQVIGLLIPRSAALIFSDPFFGHVIQNLTETCARIGYFLMLSMVTADREQGFYDNILRSRHFDGVIMLASDIDDPILPLLIKDGTPLALIGSHPYFHDLTWVDAEQREGARKAVAHLAALGHRRIATITGPLDMAAALERRDGYKHGLLVSELPIRSELIVEGDWTQESGYVAMKQLLSLSQPPTAVFVASDTMAIGAIRALNELGRSVPDDIALVSFDDLPFAAYANPPLTTIHQPIAEMTATAVQLLVAQIERKERHGQHIRLPTKLVVRESCGSKRRSTQVSTEITPVLG